MKISKALTEQRFNSDTQSGDSKLSSTMISNAVSFLLSKVVGLIQMLPNSIVASAIDSKLYSQLNVFFPSVKGDEDKLRPQGGDKV